MADLASLAERVGDCLIWPHRVGPGYSRMPKALESEFGFSSRKPIHQQICERHPGWFPGCESRHTCGNRACVNENHIVPGTKEDNMQDCVIHRTHNKVRLLPDQAIAIFNSKESNRELSVEFKISIEQVKDIRAGRSWGWLTRKQERPM